jgi:hypothetical protein
MSERLSEKAMLVRLSIGQWTARKKDKQATDTVIQEYQAGAESGYFSKALIAKEALETVSKLVNEVRTYHYAQTLPWTDEGLRILTAANFMEYSSKLREFRAGFEAAVDAFIDNFPGLVQQARLNLGGLFNPADYPENGGLAEKFKFSVDIVPMPEEGDFRVKLNDEDIAQIRADIGAKAKTAADEAMRDLWKRLHKAVKHAADTLRDPDNKFKNSLVGNLIELVDLLPRLNLTGDANLEQLRQEVRDSLCQYEPEELRKDPTARKDAAQSADDILAAMAGFVGDLD